MITLLRLTVTHIFKRLLALLGLTPAIHRSMPDSAQLQVAIERADEEIEYPTNRDEVENACFQAMCAITAEIRILRRQLANVMARFRQEYIAWMRVRDVNLTPHVILAHLAKARRYKLGGGAATLLEIILATSVLLGFSVGFLPGLLCSTAVTILLLLLADGAITGATDKPSARQSRDLIHRYVFLPALRLVVPAVAIVLSARTISGLSDLLLELLLPILQISLAVATLGLVLLSGALFAMADIYRWSQRYTERYEQIERAIAELENKREYYRLMSQQGGGLGNPLDDDNPRKPPSSLPPAALLGMLLLLSGSLTGCDTFLKPQPAKASEPAPNSRPACFGADIHVRVDRSGSVEREAATATASNFHDQLPGLIKALQSPRLTVGYYGGQSWSIPLALSVALPHWQQPSVETIQRLANEAILLPGVKQDIKARENAARKAAWEEAQKKYDTDLQKALADISPATFNPTVTKAAKCTDLYGLLARLSKGPQSGKHLYVLVGDGYHSCGPMKPLAAPSGEVTVLLLLTPANAKESAGKRADEQYLNREEALLQIAPWLKIVPGDQDNLLALLQPAESNQPTAITAGQ